MNKSFFMAVMLCFSLFFVFNFNAAAQDASSKNATEFSLSTDPSQITLNVNPAVQNNVKNPSTFGLLVKMIFALAVVAGIAYGVFYFLNKRIKTNNDNDPFLRKVSSITLSPGKSVQVITLQDSAYLIGVSDENINLIGKVDDKELVNAMNLYADKTENVEKPKSFRELLDIFMPGSSKEDQENVYTENMAEGIKRQRERLNTENMGEEQ